MYLFKAKKDFIKWLKTFQLPYSKQCKSTLVFSNVVVKCLVIDI